jgi:hypothetical protein
MCQNAAKTAGGVMAAIEPELKSLLAATGQLNTPNGIAAINAYEAADQVLLAWKSGTNAQNVIQVIGAFTTVFNTLPIPDNYKLYADIISAGIVTVIGIVTGNSPAPAPAAGITAHEDAQAMYQAQVVADTVAKVKVLVPSFRFESTSAFSWFHHSPESQSKSAWNHTVDTNPEPGIVKV